MKINKKCVGCSQCVPYCPNDSINVFGRALINEKCVECENCIKYCPLSAIEVS